MNLIKNFVFLTIKDTLTFFDKDINEQNLEIYLKDPIKAEVIKKDTKIKYKLFYLFMVGFK